MCILERVISNGGLGALDSVDYLEAVKTCTSGLNEATEHHQVSAWGGGGGTQTKE